MRFFCARTYLTVLLCAFIFMPSVAAAITVAPSRQGTVIEPGSVGRVNIVVKNSSDTVERFVPEIDAFTIDPETGRAVFGAREEALSWFSAFPRELLLQPGEQENFFFEISVPEITEIRSRYIGLFARQAPEVGQVGIGARVGSLLFLHVSGESKEALDAVAFGADQKITTDMSSVVSLVLKNTGTIHLVPEGELVVVQGGKVINEMPLNPNQKKVLPGGLWQESFELGRESFTRFGKLEIAVFVRYGVSQQAFSDRLSLWYMPWWIITIICIIAALSAGALYVSMRHRRYVKHIKKL